MQRRDFLSSLLAMFPMAGVLMRVGQSPWNGQRWIQQVFGPDYIWSNMPKVQVIRQLPQRVGEGHRTLLMRIGSRRWRHGAVALDPTWHLPGGARFVAYTNPRGAGWQGWIETEAGRLIGWVTLDGRAVPNTAQALASVK